MSKTIDGASRIIAFTIEQTDKTMESTGKTNRDSNKANRQSALQALPSTGQILQIDSARRLRAIKKQLQAEVPVVNRHKVEMIKQRIASGSYQINAESIAGKLLSTEKLWN